MIQIDTYINSFSRYIEQGKREPWELILLLKGLLNDKIDSLGEEYLIKDHIAIHKTAHIEQNVVIKSPAIIGKDSFIGANSYLRNGVFLANNVNIGTGCEIKSSIIFDHTAIAHFNFIGDSIIGSHVNFEAGSVTANHYNERKNKDIFVKHEGVLKNTKVHKFGSLIGDHVKIGANAVLSPGTLLAKKSVIKRLELVEQIRES
ncbi:DapH/DapD/GlmU-related protein [Lutimonas vermicola]|uniref:DapH/DapD/GlmU-related protein n=1 Tax=Lutimonas vermicola TaxID=414288 RepID=A0ABU9L1H5_9FLAO